MNAMQAHSARTQNCQTVGITSHEVPLYAAGIMPRNPSIKTARLTLGERALARELFTMMADVFEETREPLGDAYLDRLLGRPDFWAIAAVWDGELVGGLTAYTLELTRSQTSEIFIYDIAVRRDRQRQGVGRELIEALRTAAAAAGVDDLFVPADDEDAHALEFYRALGAEASPATFFTFVTKDQN